MLGPNHCPVIWEQKSPTSDAETLHIDPQSLRGVILHQLSLGRLAQIRQWRCSKGQFVDSVGNCMVELKLVVQIVNTSNIDFRKNESGYLIP